jgi:rod shape-determining protein MreC
VFNKGSVSGVKVDDPVIYGDGQLIGVVTKVAPTYCVVSTILDPKISISAYEVRTRESGYITNDADIVKKGFCRLSGLDRKTKVSKGSVIATAGVGGIYPRDLIIGTVREIQNDEKDISAYAVIEPNIDVTQLTEALIMIGFEGQGVAATYDDGAEGADADSPEVQSNPNRATTDAAASTESTSAGETTSSTTARRTTTTRPVTTFRTTSGRATTEASN